MPVSDSLTSCTANLPGIFSKTKYALLANTVSSDHLFADFVSRSRTSTLKRRLKIEIRIILFDCNHENFYEKNAILIRHRDNSLLETFKT